MHEVGIAAAGDELLGRLGFAAGVQDGAGPRERLRLQHVAVDPVEAARVREPITGPDAVEHLEPFGGAGIALVVLLEIDTVHPSLVGPPRRHDVERQAAAADVIDVGCLLGEQGRQMEGRADRHHQLELGGDRGERRRGRPGVQGGRLDPLDVVEVQLGEQGHVEADLLATLGKTADVVPGRRHALVGDVAQPPAEDRQPVAEAHAAAGFLPAGGTCRDGRAGARRAFSPHGAPPSRLRGNRRAARTDRSRRRAGRRRRSSRAR